MQITKLRAAYHVADDFEAAFAFYERGLGLLPRFRDASRWAEFQVGDTRFALSSVGEAAPGYGGGAVSVFQADTLDGLSERVERLGGAVLDVRDMGAHGRVATVRDPAGSILQIFVPVTT